MVGEMLNFSVMHHSLIFYGNCTKENCQNRNEIGHEVSVAHERD
jgi:Fur family ferric uptake transcriptional regulator